MQISLIAGDHDWTEEGFHTWDEKGFSIILDKPKTIEVTEEVRNIITPYIEQARINRGLNPDGSPVLQPEEQTS